MDYADVALVEKLKEDPQWANLISDIYVKLMEGDYDPEYVSVIMDRWGTHSLTFGDVFSFAQVHTILASGRALRTPIEMFVTPFSDKSAEENNRVLATLPKPFSGRFVGGPGDNDGHIAWSEPIEASLVREDGMKKVATIPPGWASLEVGHTTAERTMMHLKESHNLARWPYGSSKITIIHLVEPRGWSITAL